MTKSGKLVAVTVLLSFVPAVGRASAAPAPEALLPATPTAVVGAEAAGTAVALTPAAWPRRQASIRDSLETLQQSPPVLLLSRRATADAVAAQSSGGLSTAAKTAIWLSAITVAGVWGYKTFSVTRGTD